MRRKAPQIGAAISPARIDELFAPFANAHSLLLAVSGGPDSTALLMMAALWAKGARRPRVEVATVDHAMRAGSREEAEAVGALSRRLGLTHHLLQWRGPKPRSRIQERAREARYQLLGACAREIRADFLVTAHHADDQAETVLFRLIRGSGIGGLRGMESVAAKGRLTLARPLLGLRKAELVAFCQAGGEEYARDPSNADPRFARTHLRQLADLLAAEGLGVDEIARLSRRAARMEAAVAIQAQAAAERLGWTNAQPTRDAKALLDEPQEIVQRLLTAEIARIAGKEPRQIRLDAIETLAQALRNARAENKALRANVGGASVHLSAKGALSVSPEAPRRARAERKENLAGDARTTGLAATNF
ncbi:tRNA lysidine(34) synthetase TilS [Methylocapsa sp. S129]|uniref:tRNA lysidine(34) synthetase TilS n=1 Tax=Methylocapsa sp. S129 TaxID=1641869 RepID=UPI001FEF743D|nr:tRNA lysidine(34) synthetase TilS [Methylocapsa sp. S129]